MVKVKVCGITNLADAEKALEYGADALGFNFYPPSPRYLAPDEARAVVWVFDGVCPILENSTACQFIDAMYLFCHRASAPRWGVVVCLSGNWILW